MEHINENTIKVMIAKSDLEERGISFFDLLGNQGQVESFFYSILEEVGMKQEFEGIDAVTFQVVPKRDGLDLYITKGLNESLKDHIQNNTTPQSTKEETPLDQIIKYFEQDNNTTSKSDVKSKEKVKQRQKKKTLTSEFQVFTFNEFIDFVGFVHKVKKEEVGDNSLLHYDGQYYWGQKMSKPEFLENIHYKAIEHGDLSPISFYVVQEHGKMIMAHNAIETTQKHFK